MGLENKLSNQGSTLSNLNGGTASVPNFSQSKLHLEYSINGAPTIPGKPSPSSLDLDGVKPSSANKDASTVGVNDTFKNGTYKNNLPTGASF